MAIRATIIAGLAGLAFAGAALAAEPGDSPNVRFTSLMNSVFGAGTWRVTGGFRTPEREDELRAQGALTVPAGRISAHSLGSPNAPGAYDLVVDGLSPEQAAARLRRSGAAFRTLLAEGAHGGQGPHLHLEPNSTGLDVWRARNAVEWTVVEVTPEYEALTRLREAAVQGDAISQLRLGELYAQGRTAPRDLVAAFVWTALASTNADADSPTRREAERSLGALAGNMKPSEIEFARRFVRERIEGDPGDGQSCTPAPVADDEPVVLVIGPGDPPRPSRRAAAERSCAGSAATFAAQ